MSKKKFSEGLDDLFSDTHTVQGDPFGGSETAAARSAERRATHKNFMSGLDALLQEALEESLEKFEASQPDSATPGGKSKTAASAAAYRAPMSGLDALIRQTIDVREITSDENSGKKRLTVAVDKSKLEQLKTIARLENSYMKDLLVNLIDEYIREYTSRKGLDF